MKNLLDWWKAELGFRVLAQFNSEDALKGQQKLLKRPRRGMETSSVNGMRTITPATVNRYVVALHSTIQFGIRPLHWIEWNPVGELDKLKEPNGRTNRKGWSNIMDNLTASTSMGHSVPTYAHGPMETRKLFPVAEFVLVPEFSYETESSMRHLIFNSRPRYSASGDVILGNGLVEAGAIIRIGRKILIDADKFSE